MFFRSLRFSFLSASPVRTVCSVSGQAPLRGCPRHNACGVSTTMSERCMSSNRTFKTEQCNFQSSSQGLACFFRRSSPRTISTDQLHALLRFHLRPINQIVFLGPYSLKDERSHLRGSFTLRCFQRLSRPYIATQLCPWQNNWCTRGTSIPVLSY